MIEDEVLAHLARDPAPERRLEAIELALMSWRDGDAARREGLERRILAIAVGLDYFARIELVANLGDRRDGPACLLGLLDQDLASPAARPPSVPISPRSVLDDIALRLAGRSSFRLADIRSILELVGPEDLAMVAAAARRSGAGPRAAAR